MFFVAVIAVVAVLAIIIGAISVANWRRSVEAEGREYQNQLMSLAGQVDASMGNCLDSTLVAAGIAAEERKQAADLLIATTGARYQDKSGKPISAVNSPLAINMVHEAYPQISDKLYAQLMTTAMGCRKETMGLQTRVQTHASSFLSWKGRGNVFEGTIRESYPTSELTVQTAEGTKTGADALKFIVKPIVTDESRQASETRTMPKQDLFPTPKK